MAPTQCHPLGQPQYISNSAFSARATLARASAARATLALAPAALPAPARVTADLLALARAALAQMTLAGSIRKMRISFYAL